MTSTARASRVEAAVLAASPTPPAWRSWSVWTVAATFYLAAFYLRTSPAVIHD
jgi:hypothetical protein